MGGGDVCCLLTAGDHQRAAIEKLISFTQRLRRRTYASVSEVSKSSNLCHYARRAVSLRTEKMCSMFRLQNKRCSATGPSGRCSGPEQYQKWFRYDLYRYPQHLGLYEIHCLKVEINRTYLWHIISKNQSPDVILCNYIDEFVT